MSWDGLSKRFADTLQLSRFLKLKTANVWPRHREMRIGQVGFKGFSRVPGMFDGVP